MMIALKYDDVDDVAYVMIPSLSGRKRQNCCFVPRTVFFFFCSSGWSGWGDQPESDENENLASDLVRS